MKTQFASTTDVLVPDILKTNVEGIALISAITKATDPDKVTKKLLARIP
jgi:thiamine monophosphate synthase